MQQHRFFFGYTHRATCESYICCNFLFSVLGPNTENKIKKNQNFFIKTLKTELIYIYFLSAKQVNDVNFENMSNDDAVRILREIVSKPG